MNFLKNHKAKTISIDEIKTATKIKDQYKLSEYIHDLLNNNVLTAIKSSGQTMEYPYVPNRYRIVQKDYSKILKQIEEISSLIDMSYYKRHPESFQNDKTNILYVENYIKNKLRNETILSVNERSLEIFNDEKFLMSANGKKLLKNLQMSLDDFNVYMAPEVFMYYKHAKCNSGNILIIENKDTWTTIKNVLIDGLTIMGLNFDAVIFGEGKKIISSFAFIKDNEFKEFNALTNHYYYFGDIDSSGIQILHTLQHKYKEYNIQPFMPAYNYLFNNVCKYSHVKLKDNREEKQDNHIAKEIIRECFPDKDCDAIYDFCMQNKIIPQEALNNRILRERTQ